MKPPKDKRTKAYKQWYEKYGEDYKSEIKTTKGLGDEVEKIAQPIKKALKIPEGCGCDERKSALNRMFRFSYNREVVRCLTPEMAEEWGRFKDKYDRFFIKSDVKKVRDIPLTPGEQMILIEFGMHLFAVNYTKDLKRGCNACKMYLIIDINRVYES